MNEPQQAQIEREKREKGRKGEREGRWNERVVGNSSISSSSEGYAAAGAQKTQTDRHGHATREVSQGTVEQVVAQCAHAEGVWCVCWCVSMFGQDRSGVLARRELSRVRGSELW